MRSILALCVCLFVAVPAVAKQQHKHQKPPESAAVDFGILPPATGPIGGDTSGCPAAGVGSPADPCSYSLHALIPNEVTIQKGGEVTFHVHGGGHGFAIYKVSKKTTRDDIGQQLCVGDDPATIPLPGALHTCNNGLGLGGNANAPRQVLDAKDDVVLVVPLNVAPGTYPTTNRVWYEPGRLMSANAPAFLAGGTAAAPASEILTYRFLKTGRYLVLCANRSHFFNDWMFGFVDVEGGDDND
jgi:hypothetical protein